MWCIRGYWTQIYPHPFIMMKIYSCPAKGNTETEISSPIYVSEDISVSGICGSQKEKYYILWVTIFLYPAYVDDGQRIICTQIYERRYFPVRHMGSQTQKYPHPVMMVRIFPCPAKGEAGHRNICTNVYEWTYFSMRHMRMTKTEISASIYINEDISLSSKGGKPDTEISEPIYVGEDIYVSGIWWRRNTEKSAPSYISGDISLSSI